MLLDGKNIILHHTSTTVKSTNGLKTLREHKLSSKEKRKIFSKQLRRNDLIKIETIFLFVKTI